jgi:Flp pilus assembly protein TadG
VNRSRARQGGQALTEFALVVPLFFILVFGVIQMGILLGGQIGLTNTAREVARYASTVAAGSQTNATITTFANPMLQRSIPAYNAGAVSTVTYCWYLNPVTATNPVATYSQKVIVSIRYGHTLFVPLVGTFIDGFDGVRDNKLTVTAREEMKVEAQPAKSQPAGTDCTTLIGANP